MGSVGEIYADVGLRVDRSGLNSANSMIKNVETSLNGVGNVAKSVSASMGSGGFGGALEQMQVSMSGVTASSGAAAFGAREFGYAVTAMGQTARATGSTLTSFSSSATTGLANTSSAMTSLSSSSSHTFSSISSSANGAKTSFTGLGQTARSAFTGLGSTIKTSLSSAFDTVTSLPSKVKTSFTGLKDSISQSLTSAKNSAVSFASSAQEAFTKLTAAGQAVYNKLGLIGTAAVAIFTTKLSGAIQSATSVFMGFDDQMRKVQAVSGSTGDQFQQLTNQAKLLGATTSFSAQEASEAMTYLGQAGFNANQIIAAMPATLNLARGSMTELGTTADIMSNIMNGFQISAEDTGRAADVLSKAANATNTDVTGLGQAMKYAAPLAHQMGWSLEETAAAAGNLSNAGIKADMAGTVLRNAITRLIAPTDKVIATLANYGISMDMVNPKVYSLAQILDTLTAAGVSSGNMMTIFGMRAGPGMMALVNQGTTSLKNMNQTLLDSGGYAQKAADEMDAGWGGVVRRLGDTVEALQLSFGGAIANILTPFAEAAAGVGYVISQLPSPIIYLASTFTLASVAAGVLLTGLAALPVVAGVLSAGTQIAAGGLLSFAVAAYNATGSTGILSAALTLTTGSFDGILTGAAKAVLSLTSISVAETVTTVATWAATAAVSALDIALGILTSPITLVVAAIVALGIALYEINEKTQIATKTWETLQDLWTIGSYYIGQAFDGLKDTVSDAIDWILEKIRSLVDDTGIGNFVDKIVNAYDRISGALGNTRDSIHDTAENIRDINEKTATGAANVQKQIQSANGGIVTSYNTVDKETGETYASMIENAGSASDAVTGSNGEVDSSNSDLVSSYGNVSSAHSDVAASSSKVTDSNQNIISSNNNLIESNKAVTASSPTIKYTLDQTDIDSIVDPTKGKEFLTADALNKGIQLDDGSMLRFNEAGQLVIQTLDGIQKRVYDIGNTDLTTADSKKIWSITDNYQETNGKYVNTGPTTHVSLAESHAAAEDEDKYQKSPEATEAEWAKQHPNDTIVHTKKDAGNGQRAPKIADRYSTEQVNDMLVDKKNNDVIESKTIEANPKSATGKASIERGARVSNSKNPLNGQGKTPLSDDYKEALKQQEIEERPSGIYNKIKSGIGGLVGNNDTSKSTEGVNALGKAIQWVNGLSVSDVVTGITGVGVASGKATDYTDNLGTSATEVNYVRLSDVVGGLFNVGSNADSSSGKTSLLSSVMGTLNQSPFSSILGNLGITGSSIDTNTGKTGIWNTGVGSLISHPFSTLFGNLGTSGSQIDTNSGKTGIWNSGFGTLVAHPFSSLFGNLGTAGSNLDSNTGKTSIWNSGVGSLVSHPFSTLLGNLGTSGSNIDTNTGKTGFWKSGIGTLVSHPFSTLFGNLGTSGVNIDTNTGKTGFWNTGIGSLVSHPFTTLFGNLGTSGVNIDTNTGKTGTWDTGIGSLVTHPFSTLFGNLGTSGSNIDTDNGKTGDWNTSLGNLITHPFTTLFGSIDTTGSKTDDAKKKIDDAIGSLKTFGGFTFSTTLSSLGSVYNTLGDIYERAKNVVSELFKADKASNNSNKSASSTTTHTTNNTTINVNTKQSSGNVVTQAKRAAGK